MLYSSPNYKYMEPKNECTHCPLADMLQQNINGQKELKKFYFEKIINDTASQETLKKPEKPNLN